MSSSTLRSLEQIADQFVSAVLSNLLLACLSHVFLLGRIPGDPPRYSRPERKTLLSIVKRRLREEGCVVRSVSAWTYPESIWSKHLPRGMAVRLAYFCNDEAGCRRDIDGIVEIEEPSTHVVCWAETSAEIVEPIIDRPWSASGLDYLQDASFLHFRYLNWIPELADHWFAVVPYGDCYVPEVAQIENWTGLLNKLNETKCDKHKRIGNLLDVTEQLYHFGNDIWIFKLDGLIAVREAFSRLSLDHVSEDYVSVVLKKM